MDFQKQRLKNLGYAMGGLPAKCSNVRCQAKFPKNLYQESDHVVYCTICGNVLGKYPPGTIPFKIRDDNALP